MRTMKIGVGSLRRRGSAAFVLAMFAASSAGLVFDVQPAAAAPTAPTAALDQGLDIAAAPRVERPSGMITGSVDEAVLAAIASPGRSAAAGVTAPARDTVPFGTIADPTAADGYQPLTPSRILDTRDGLGVADRLDATEVSELEVTGRGGVPSTGVAAVVLNLTATNVTEASYVTAWPAGLDRPLASNLNVVPGADVPNLVIVPVGTGASAGRIALYNNAGSVDLVGDVEGWFPVASDYRPVVPTRIMDTRLGMGVAATLHEHDTVELRVAGNAGVPATGVGAVVVNLTATNPTASTYVTAWPSGVAQPLASNLNVVAGQTSPNLVIVPLGANGSISLYNNAGDTDLVADVQGWFPSGSDYRPVSPTRILDSREGQGIGAALAQASSADLQVTGQGGIPGNGVAAVVLNVTATNPTSNTYVTVWPAGVDRPLASNVNVAHDETRPNLVIVPVGADGKVSFYNNGGSTDLVADVQGWFPIGFDTDAPTASTWTVRPASVLLEPNSSRIVTLKGVDGTGDAIDAAAAQTVQFETAGSGVTAEYLGNNEVRLTSGGEFRSTVFAIRVDGDPVPASLTASVVALQPGVVEVPDEQVRFPAPYNAGSKAGVVDGQSVYGFTIDEIRARTNISADDAPVPSDFMSTDTRFPLIVSGSPIPTGTLILTAGGSGVNGIVVEPAGVPSLERGGLSLMSVQSVPLSTLYDQLVYDVDTDAVTSLGLPGATPPQVALTDAGADGRASAAVSEASGSMSIAGAAETETSAGSATPADASTSVEITPNAMPAEPAVADDQQTAARDAQDIPHADPDPSTPTTAGPQPSTTAPPTTAGPQPSTPDTTPATIPGQGDPGLLGNECSATIGRAEVGYNTIVPAFRLSFDDYKVDVHNQYYKVVPALTGTITAGFTIDFQGRLSAECNFPVTPKITGKVPVPLGPLSGLLFGVAGHQFIAKFSLSAKAGPHVTWKLNCKAGGTIKVGFIADHGEYSPVHSFDPDYGCPDKWPTWESGISDAGISAQVEITGQLFQRIDLGGQVGGAISAAIGSLFGDPDLGTKTLLKFDVGPKLGIVVENSAWTLAEKASGTTIKASFAGSVSVDAANINWLLKAFSNSAGAVDITLFSQEINFLDPYVAPSVDTLQYSVDSNGDAVKDVDGTVYVEPGDTVTIYSNLNDDAGHPQFEDVYQHSNAISHVSDLFAQVSTGQAKQWAVRATITGEYCEQQNDGNGTFAPVEYRIIGSAKVGSGSDSLVTWSLPFDAPVWGGVFNLQCVQGKMRVVPDTIDNFANSAHVTLSSRGKSDPDTWTVKTPLPAFVQSVSPNTGTWHYSPTEYQPVQLTVTQANRPSDVCYEPGEGDITFLSQHRGDAKLHLEEPDPCYIKFDVDSVTGTGPQVVHVLTLGRSDDTWGLDSTLPSWISQVNPASKALPIVTSETSYTFGFFVEPREATCIVQLPEVAEIRLKTLTRGKTQTLRVTRPKVPRKDGCAPATGSGTGDPHMRSFDGGYYEGQVRGEFIYARTTPGADADVEVRVRHQPTKIGAILYPVTSVTATLVRVGEHKVEVYARDDSDEEDPQALSVPIVLVDGVETVLDAGSPLEVADGFSIVRNGATVEFNAPYIHVTTRTYGAIMDTTVAADIGAPVEGLLGTPDDQIGDDFTGPGGAPAYSYALIQQRTTEGIQEVRDFTGEWKVDPAETLFTRSYLGNDDPDPVIDPAELAQLLARAEDLLNGLDTLCDVQGAIDDHLLDGLALELGIGRTSKELSAYSCQYVVRGTALSGDSPIPGLDVSVEVPGLTSCTTTTGSDGRYQCVLTPDYDPASGDPKPAAPPWTVDVQARFAGSPAVIASNSSVTIDQRAEVSGQPVGVFVDLSIDPALLPNLDVSGTMLQAGQPYPDPVTVTVKGYDASNRQLVELLQTVTPDPVDGSYSFTKVLPVGATRATVVAAVGLVCCPGADYPAVTPTGLHNGPNAVPFSFDDNPPIVGFTGTMTGLGGAGLSGPITVSYQTFNGAAVVNGGFLTVSPAGDGSYTIPPIRMPRTATSVTITAQVGVVASDYPTQTFALVPGTTTKTFNVSYVPPTLTITGNVTKAGVGLSGPMQIGVSYFNASNVQLGNIQVVNTGPIDPATGHFSIAPFAIPIGTKRISAHAQIGVLQTSYTTRQITNASTGSNSLDMTFDFNPPIVTVTGIALKNGSPYTTPFGLQLLSFYGVDLYTQAQSATPDAHGHYAATFEAPMGTFKVQAIAQIGPVVAEYPKLGDTAVTNGAQDVAFDITYNTPEVTISGTLKDAAGNPMEPGQTVGVIAYDDSAGTHQVFNTFTQVDPAAGTGAYTWTATVPTTTKSVRAFVRIGPLSDQVNGALTQVVIGTGNNITLNAVYDPPILRLHGTMTMPGGAPYTGDVFVRVQSKDAGGNLLRDSFETAHLDANGAYSNIDRALPLATATVVITPQAGSSTLWVPVTKSVSPGVNAFLLDVVQNVPRLNISGTFTRNGSPFTSSFGIKVEAMNAGGTVVQTFNTGVTASSSGVFNLTWDAPISTTSARVTYDVSPFAFDDIVHTFGGIQTGVNDLAFDVNDSSRRLQLSGTVTSDGQPVANQTVQVAVNYGHGTPRTQDALQFYDVPTDATGHYSFDQIVPDAATQAFVDANVPTGFGSSTAPVSTEITGMTGLVTAQTFNPAYTPLHLQLSGTITVDGVAPAGTVPVQVLMSLDNNQTYTTTVQVDPDDATGHYATTIPEPFNTATATVTIEVGPDYDWFVSTPITLLDAADTPATFDAIYDPVYLTVTGRIRDLGVAADHVWVRIEGRDAQDHTTSSLAQVELTPVDSTGAFDHVVLTAPYPRTAVSLAVFVNYHLTTDVQPGPVRGFVTGLTVAGPPKDETIVVNRDTQGVDVTGVTTDGNGVGTNFSNLAVSTSEYDADHNNLGGSGFLLGYDDANGSFSMHLEPNRNAATIDISIGGGPAVTVDVTHNVDAFHTTADIGDYVIATGATLRISGGFTMGEDPDTGQTIGPDSVRIVVTPYVFDKDGWQSDPPYVHNGAPIEIAPEDVAIGAGGPDHPEEFFTTATIPAGTNLLDVQYFVNDDAVPYRSGYLVDPNDANPLVQYFDYGAPQTQIVDVHTTFGHYSATPTPNCGIYTDSPFIVRLTAETYAVSDPDHTRSVFDGIIVPDPDEGAVVTIKVPVEPGHDKIDFSDDTTGIYTDAHMSWSGGTGQMLDPGGTISTFFGRGCNPFDPQP